MSVIDFNLKPIESEVFRFVSVRNPQRVTKSAMRLWAVQYDTDSGSALYDDLVAAILDPANGTEAAKLAACKTLAEAFKASEGWIADVDTLDALLPGYVGLYDWFQQNLSSLTIASVTAKLGGVELLDPSVALRIWDNLFARLILGGDGGTRTALMEALVLNHVVDNHGDEELVANEADVRILVRSEVIIPDTIFPLPGTDAKRGEPEVAEEDSSKVMREELIAKAKDYLAAMVEIESAFDGKIEELTLNSLLVKGKLYDGEETREPDLPLLTQDLLDNFAVSTVDILSEYRLEKGMQLQYCLQVIAKKLAGIHDQISRMPGPDRSIVNVGGALWRAAGKDGEVEDPIDCEMDPATSGAGTTGYDDFYAGSGLCRIKPLGIGDLLKVEQKLCCYAPGEVAHIENILQGEYKERSTRRLLRTEQTFATIVEREESEERDSISADIHEIQRETNSVIQQDRSFDLGISVTAHYGPVNVNVNSNFATSTSNTTANNQATFFAQNVTERSLKRIIERTREERIQTIINEFEETNKHGLDNRLGTAHVVGLYRWADKIYEVWIRNYGKRLMFEFLIPEPAAFHLWAMTRPDVAAGVVLEEPVDPCSTDVVNAYGLTPLNQNSSLENTYATWGKYYDVALDPPPPVFITLSVASSESGLNMANNFARTVNGLNIPPGYQAYQCSAMVLKNNAGGWVTVQVGNLDQQYFFNINIVGPRAFGMSNEEGEMPITIVGRSDFYALNVKVVCLRMAETLQAWKKDVFDKIITAYNNKKAAYDQALAAAKAGYGTGYFGTNPAMNRQIEQAELKKGCLNWLTYGRGFSTDAMLNMDSDDDCKPPIALTDCCVVEDTERVKFLEQVFDWQNMTYAFYPYFYGQRCRWKKLYQLQDSDPQFLNFLQAGMARVLVPVRLHFEREAMYFLRTGEIWSGGDVPGINSELYLSIIEELYPKYGTEWHSDKWELRVPTNLTVLQCESGCIDGEGLPCECGTGIGTTSNPLVAGTGDPVLPGSGHD